MDDTPEVTSNEEESNSRPLNKASCRKKHKTHSEIRSQELMVQQYFAPEIVSRFKASLAILNQTGKWFNFGVESCCTTIVINKSALEFNLAFIVRLHAFFLKNVTKMYTTRTTATMPATVLPTMMARVSLNLMPFSPYLVKKGNGKGNCISYLLLLRRHITIFQWRVTPIIVERGCRGRGRKKNEKAELTEGVHCPHQELWVTREPLLLSGQYNKTDKHSYAWLRLGKQGKHE